MVTTGLLVGLMMSLGAAGPRAEPPELAVLNRLAGHWKGTFHAQPEEIHRSETNAEWKVRGSFLVSTIVSNPGTANTSEAMIVWTYNAQSSRYARTFYIDGGLSFHEEGTWNESTKTFLFEGTLGTAKTKSTVRLLDDGSIAWTIELRNEGGEPTTITGKNERVAK